MSVQSEDALKEVGKIAALVEDGSPLQLGTTGTVEGERFKIVGRIQYHFGLGYWNEWYLNMPQSKSGDGAAWIGEANGMYFFTRQLAQIEGIDAVQFDNLNVGDYLKLNSIQYMVKDIQSGKVVSGEGELPFSFTAEYEAPVVDLVSRAGDFATLDFSEEAPLMFVGREYKFKDLQFASLRSVYGFKAQDAEVKP